MTSMTLKEVATMVASIGYPYAYDHFIDGTAQDPPFVVFFYEYSPMYADGKNYSDVRTLNIELATNNKDFTAEAAVESALASSDLAWAKAEQYIEGEQLYEVVYSADIVIREEDTTDGNE